MKIGRQRTREAAMAAFAKSWQRVLINAQIAAPLLWAIHIGCLKNCTHCSMVVAQKLRPRTHGQAAVHRFCTPMLRPKSPGGGDDRVSGTDAERHDDIYHIGSSGF
jgi:hypothetical protein